MIDGHYRICVLKFYTSSIHTWKITFTDSVFKLNWMKILWRDFSNDYYCLFLDDNIIDHTYETGDV